jgi:hypothetical protein
MTCLTLSEGNCLVFISSVLTLLYNLIINPYSVKKTTTDYNSLELMDITIQYSIYKDHFLVDLQAHLTPTVGKKLTLPNHNKSKTASSYE